MNKPIADVTQLHRTYVILVLGNDEFTFAPHDFTTAMQILTSHAVQSNETQGHVALENEKTTRILVSAVEIRDKLKQQQRAYNGGIIG